MTSMEEPSVLDYVKSKLRFWRRGEIEVSEEPPPALTEPPPPDESSRGWPWRALLALGLALLAQRAFELPHDSPRPGIVLYFLAFSALGWALLHGEWPLAEPPAVEEREAPFTLRVLPLLLSLVLALAAFLDFGENLFTRRNVTLWLLALASFLWAFYLGRFDLRARWECLVAFLRRDRWQITLSRWTLLFLAAIALVTFFRIHNLTITPAEPFSDHAEKILDIYDITQGQSRVFFPRNTGREGFQMYWTLLIARVFHTGLSFLSLKLGTALLGLLTLPYLYLLGMELGNRRVGLLTMVFAGIAYWPNVISRVGLRFPLYPLFVAPTLYYLFRGLRTQNRNDFLLSGLFLGIGLHGYSPFRIVPLVVVIAFGVYLLHPQSKGRRVRALWWLVILGLTALILFLPLARYALMFPDIFNYRALSRLGTVERPLPGPAWQIFLSNLWNALRMFNWDNGSIWVHSVPHRPALGVVSGALFLLGVVLILVRYFRRWRWQDLFLLLSIPLLQLPSILSLAYPAENPALNRAGGAMVPVFLIVGLALDGLLTGLTSGLEKRRGTVAAWVLLGVLLLWSGAQNYNLVFHKYHEEFRMGSWNSSEMGAVIRQFGQTYGNTDAVWIVPYTHWVDTRLPGVWAGIPNRDFAKWRERLYETLDVPAPKLFLVKPEDEETVEALKSLYPQGTLSRYTSAVEGHDFLIFFVPE